MIPSSDYKLSETLFRNYDKSGPRYTSYPTADRFDAAFTEQTYIDYVAQQTSSKANPPLYNYVHLPFCESLC